MENFNVLSMPTRVEVPLGTYDNFPEAKRDCTKSYSYIICIMLYLASKTIPKTYFYVHKCAWFTNNTKASHDSSVKRMYHYLQYNKEKGLVLNPYEIMVVGFYVNEDFSGLWGHENTQDPICANSRTAKIYYIVGIKDTDRDLPFCFIF